MKTNQEKRDLMLKDFEQEKREMSNKEKKQLDELFTILDEECKDLRVIRREINNKIKEINKD